MPHNHRADTSVSNNRLDAAMSMAEAAHAQDASVSRSVALHNIAQQGLPEDGGHRLPVHQAGRVQGELNMSAVSFTSLTFRFGSLCDDGCHAVSSVLSIVHLAQ
eukprot:TRINITY_DN7640_c0_g1_i1.p4 TRINITY_DN7640_c0_g1~~TRINITY_DN7640_c0_g1_i1.p4  ORF type:complete len:104 (-),score=10.21 TRINITY_DN7640_c0_g1_i1:1267-1578(-)